MASFKAKYRHKKSENVRLYNIYKGMVHRCTHEKTAQYEDYGGRGITVCNEWLVNYDNFADWAYANGYEDNLTIDRIDNNGNYEPNNCKWSTRKEQNRNKRNNFMITYRRETKCLRTWCEELNLPYDQMRNRIVNLGWNPERAFEERIHYFEESIMHEAKAHGLEPRLVYDRINKLGWDYSTAVNTPVGSVDVTSKEYKEEHFGYAYCAVCGEKFLKQNFGMKYCSPKCHKDSQRAWFKKKIS